MARQGKPWELAAAEKNEEGAVFPGSIRAFQEAFFRLGFPLLDSGLGVGRKIEAAESLTELGTNEGMAVRIKKKNDWVRTG